MQYSACTLVKVESQLRIGNNSIFVKFHTNWWLDSLDRMSGPWLIEFSKIKRRFMYSILRFGLLISTYWWNSLYILVLKTFCELLEVLDSEREWYDRLREFLIFLRKLDIRRRRWHQNCIYKIQKKKMRLNVFHTICISCETVKVLLYYY